MSAQFPGGWLDLAEADPINVTNFIAYAILGPTSGVIKASSNFNTPTGSWVSTPLAISAVPTVIAVNAAQFPDEGMLANAMNAQTVTANLAAPPPLTNLVYLYGNENGSLKYEMNIPLNFGGSSYNSVQISILENAGTSGDAHGKIQVIDFGTGPFTGVLLLKMMFSGYYGPVHFGIRISDGSNTSIFDLWAIVLPIDTKILSQGKGIATLQPSGAMQMEQINGGNNTGEFAAQAKDCGWKAACCLANYIPPPPPPCPMYLPTGCDRLYMVVPCRIVIS